MWTGATIGPAASYMEGNRGRRRNPNRFRGDGKTALSGHGSAYLLGDAMTVEDIRVLLALLSSRRLPCSNPHQELFVIYLIPSLPLSCPLGQLLYSRLRFCMFCA